MAERLSELEREQIASGRDRGESIRSIAARLGRASSTISREIARTALPHLDGRYSSWWAQARAVEQASKSRMTPRLARPGVLREAVIGKLNRRWSPRQIATWLRLEFPDQPEMHVSHETIYQAIYLQSRGNLRAELKHQKALRSGRTRRRAQPAGAISCNRAWIGLHISARPAEAADRAVPGHWEGDLLIGKAGHSAIATLVERSSRFVMLVALPGGKVSEHVAEQLSQAMSRLPETLRRSLAWDQGSEMARHLDFTVATGCPVYFCDPHSPWQRGSNENTNGLLRDYFPSASTDFRTISQTDLDQVADELNTRIRETLNWQTPAAKLAELLAVANAA
jgi:transposase, IS30 family